MRVLIIGGVAGGASCAARLRRLEEHAAIVLIERGPFVSYANCGLPYHVGGVIEHEQSLLVASAETLRAQLALDVRTGCEAIAIDPAARRVTLRDVASGATQSESYDELVLAPGAVSVRPPFPGIDLPGIFALRTVPDARAMRAWIERDGPHVAARRSGRAVVVGGGFIGLETAENLVRRGFATTVVELLDQVLPPLDRELARLVEERLRAHGVELVLGDGVAAFDRGADGALTVSTKAGRTLPADLVVLALGVRPDTALAKAAGLAIGERGGIRVDAQMRTSDPHIYAVGDVVEVHDTVTGDAALVALAGPANRQGRIAADAIAGRASAFRGAQGTAIVGLFGLTVAWTGATEKALRRRGDSDYEKVYLHPGSHAGYYPGATPIALKLLFRKSDGKLLGAQACGEDGVDKRISALAVFLQMGATVYDLEEAELCYAPQFGSAKDPVNLAGMIAANTLRGDLPLAHWAERGEGLLLDVREASELEAESVPGAVHIPLGELRKRLSELPREREIHVFCRSGQRAYLATRLLLQRGFRARDLSGGMLSRRHLLA
jgi:NADPH-dependent 2,4-dienoyl-CoA reductase/sulfur reductase-like enzyme/rhodanese-related sulfurtransferase